MVKWCKRTPHAAARCGGGGGAMRCAAPGIGGRGWLWPEARQTPLQSSPLPTERGVAAARGHGGGGIRVALWPLDRRLPVAHPDGHRLFAAVDGSPDVDHRHDPASRAEPGAGGARREQRRSVRRRVLESDGLQPDQPGLVPDRGHLLRRQRLLAAPRRPRARHQRPRLRTQHRGPRRELRAAGRDRAIRAGSDAATAARRFRMPRRGGSSTG